MIKWFKTYVLSIRRDFLWLLRTGAYAQDKGERTCISLDSDDV